MYYRIAKNQSLTHIFDGVSRLIGRRLKNVLGYDISPIYNYFMSFKAKPPLKEWANASVRRLLESLDTKKFIIELVHIAFLRPMSAKAPKSHRRHVLKKSQCFVQKNRYIQSAVYTLC